jgi:hypothetical protein
VAQVIAECGLQARLKEASMQQTPGRSRPVRSGGRSLIRRWSLGLLILLLGSLPVLAVPEGTGSELDRNRRLLERWRTDPEHYQRLLNDLRAFHALPATQQERLRQFDRQLHEVEPATLIRLWGVLDRFATWLEHLPETQRQQIMAASGDEKLALIKELRDREWIERLPAPLRKEVEDLPPHLRPARVAELRREERRLRRIWLTPPAPKPGPINRPALWSELPGEVQRFFQEYIDPRLTDQEREDLHRAEGQWPRLPRKVLQFSERYPVYPPLPVPYKIVRRYEDLPLDVQRVLPRSLLEKRKPKGPDLERLEGRWPDYALAVVNLAGKDRLPVPLGASRPSEFPRPIEDYLRGVLVKKLDEKELKDLHQLEGHWPAYPKRLHELARRHRLVIPGMTLPGPRELWENALAVLPEVPGHILRDFVMQMSPRDRAALRLNPAEPFASRERIKRAYFLKHPNRLPRGVPPPALLIDSTP